MMGEGMRLPQGLPQVQGRKPSGLSPKQKGSWEPVEVKAKHWISFTRVKKKKNLSSSLKDCQYSYRRLSHTIWVESPGIMTAALKCFNVHHPGIQTFF